VNVNSTLTLLCFSDRFRRPDELHADHAACAEYLRAGGASLGAGEELRRVRRVAKREGGRANYGSPGNGTHHHLIMESLKLRTGLEITHIPYKGSPAFTDLIGGQIATMFVRREWR